MTLKNVFLNMKTDILTYDGIMSDEQLIDVVLKNGLDDMTEEEKNYFCAIISTAYRQGYRSGRHDGFKQGTQIRNQSKAIYKDMTKGL